MVNMTTSFSKNAVVNILHKTGFTKPNHPSVGKYVYDMTCWEQHMWHVDNIRKKTFLTENVRNVKKNMHESNKGCTFLLLYACTEYANMIYDS